MSDRARFRKIDLQRVIKAARDEGVSDYKVRLLPGGEIEFAVGKRATDQFEPVELE